MGLDYTIEKPQWPMKVTKLGGRLDGLSFQMVDVVYENGDRRGAWISDQFPGQLFKQVFVPIDFDHPDIVK